MANQAFWTTTLIMGLICFNFSLSAQSIDEKKARLQSSESDLDRDTEDYLLKINKEILQLHSHIEKLYDEVLKLYRNNAPESEYKALLSQINEEKLYLYSLENRWRELVSNEAQGEGYGLWHAPDTNLEQLIIDYGSQDYVYLIPEEVGSIKLSVDSNLPIPRSSWREMLDLILRQNGVGIRTLNPFLRQLYLIKEDHSNLRLITNQPKDLEVLPPDVRVSFLLSPEPSEVRRTYTFLEKFINPNTTVVQIVGRDILIIGRVADIQDLLRLYQFIAANRGEKDYRLVPLYKTSPEEMAKVLTALFDQEDLPQEGQNAGNDGNGLRIIPLQNMAQALFIVGTRAEVRKAEEIIQNVESQIGGARDREIYWYTVKHSSTEELADILYRVYMLMISSGAGVDEGSVTMMGGGSGGNSGQAMLDVGPQNSEGYLPEPGGGLLINPKPVQPGVFVQTDPNNSRDNFIVDLKTGSIVMVVEADILPKMKELIAKLDVPKKMVQIEVLLFEKIFKRENSFGLNILRIGEHIAKNKNLTGLVFNTLGENIRNRDLNGGGKNRLGISEFFLSRKKSDSGMAPFDLAYRFLLSQDDVQINDSPSILTLNQTAATISVVDEISLNTGAAFDDDNSGRYSRGDQFTREQYGITISIKPTIHTMQEDDNCYGYDYVTLDTNIVFDTFQASEHNNRPDVTRRNIKSEVDVPDNQTVILGGLRKKLSNDSKDAIPFIGELPGIGKLFSLNNMKDSASEMFIFITPRIVQDPKEQLNCIRQDLLSIRPGDVPYFLECIEEAHRAEKEKLMEGSMRLLFGRPNPRYYFIDDCCCESGEYDGS